MELTENAPSGLGLVVENILYYRAKPVSIDHTFRLSKTSSFTLSIEIPEEILVGENLQPEKWNTEKEVKGGVEKTRFSNLRIPFFCHKRLVLKEFPDVELFLQINIHEQRIQIYASKCVKSERKIHIMRFERFSRCENPLPSSKHKRVIVKGNCELVILLKRQLIQKDARESEISKLIDVGAFFDD